MYMCMHDVCVWGRGGEEEGGTEREREDWRVREIVYVCI